MNRFTPQERLAVATVIRDYIHEQPWSLCAQGNFDECPDWAQAFDIRNRALAPLERSGSEYERGYKDGCRAGASGERDVHGGIVRDSGGYDG